MDRCPHSPRMLQNPRRSAWSGLWTADCAPARDGCGEIIVLNAKSAQKVGQDGADVNHGGPLADSLMGSTVRPS